MAVTEVTLRTDLGEVDVRLVADRSRHTVGDLAAAVLGRRAPDAVDVDGRRRPAGTCLDDAGIRRGSTVDVSSAAALAAPTAPPLAELEQVAGFGTGAVARLGEGLHRIGTTRRINADHLERGAVDEPVLLVEVDGERIRVAAAGPRAVWVDGRRLGLDPVEWNSGMVVGADRVLCRRVERGDHRTRHPEHGVSQADLDEHHPSPAVDARLAIGRRLDDDGRARALHVDARAGIGIVADPSDTLAILRSLALELAARPDLVDRIVIRTDRPRSWEWAKWFPQVDERSIVAPEAVLDEHDASTDEVPSTDADRLLVIVDRISPDALPASLPSDAIVIAGATASHQLPILLGTVVEPLDDGTTAAVRVTTTVDDRSITFGRIAPHTRSERGALDTVRRLSRERQHRDSGVPDEPSDSASMPRDDDTRDDTPDVDVDLELEAWTVTRQPTPLERRILRHSIRPLRQLEPPAATEPDDEWVEPDHRTPLDELYGRALVDESRIVLPLGWWLERDGVATIQLSQGRHLLLTGKPKCGRSTLVSLMAEGARHADERLQLFALAPRRGPLLADGRADRLDLDVASSPDEVKDWVERIRNAVRPLVFFDDADRVGGPSLDRLGGDDFEHVTAVLTARPGLSSNHWSAPWHATLLTVQLDAPGEGALVTRHRSRTFRSISPDERNG